MLPQLLQPLHTWSEVSGKVLGGADLFLQGVLVPQVGCTGLLLLLLRLLLVDTLRTCVGNTPAASAGVVLQALHLLQLLIALSHFLSRFTHSNCPAGRAARLFGGQPSQPVRARQPHPLCRCAGGCTHAVAVHDGALHGQETI